MTCDQTQLYLGRDGHVMPASEGGRPGRLAPLHDQSWSDHCGRTRKRGNASRPLTALPSTPGTPDGTLLGTLRSTAGRPAHKGFPEQPFRLLVGTAEDAHDERLNTSWHVALA